MCVCWGTLTMHKCIHHTLLAFCQEYYPLWLSRDRPWINLHAQTQGGDGITWTPSTILLRYNRILLGNDVELELLCSIIKYNNIYSGAFLPTTAYFCDKRDWWCPDVSGEDVFCCHSLLWRDKRDTATSASHPQRRGLTSYRYQMLPPGGGWDAWIAVWLLMCQFSSQSLTRTSDVQLKRFTNEPAYT